MLQCVCNILFVASQDLHGQACYQHLQWEALRWCLWWDLRLMGWCPVGLVRSSFLWSTFGLFRVLISLWKIKGFFFLFCEISFLSPHNSQVCVHSLRHLKRSWVESRLFIMQLMILCSLVHKVQHDATVA